MKRNRWIILLTVLAVAAGALGLAFARPGQAGPLPLSEAAGKVFEDLEDMTEYDEEEFFDIVGVAPEDYTEFIYCTGENEIGLVAREILIVRAKDKAAAERVRDALTAYHARRETETRSYAPDIYAMLEKSSVTVKGNTVVLIISTDSAAETAEFLQGE